MNRARLVFEEQALRCRHADFTARYLAACNLHALLRKKPQFARPETVRNLERVMGDRHIIQHRQSIFLFRETAQALAAIFAHGEIFLADCALTALKRLLRHSTGAPHRAVAEAMGTLPFALPAQPVRPRGKEEIPLLGWDELLAENGIVPAGPPAVAGRSLVVPLARAMEVFVVKLARRDDDHDALRREAFWLEHLPAVAASLPVRFDIPKPVAVAGACLFQLHDLPLTPPVRSGRQGTWTAIAFTAHEQYFSYPNDRKNLPGPNEFVAVMKRNAWLLAALTVRGIVHTAPIPLFHNRVQRERRDDSGVYDWLRGGRLDQWLASCDHPNFGASGTRDFEHLETIAAPGRRLFRYVGVHLLSLLLVAGSYFRNRERDLAGVDKNGLPVDARHLFDRHLLETLVLEIFRSYYQAFAGQDFTGRLPFGVKGLVQRMIEEMGVDRHMEEVLRRADQQAMSGGAFQRFLRARGYGENAVAGLGKGAADIVILTGPHLGGFNERISIPELIDATASMAAICIVGRHAGEKR